MKELVVVDLPQTLMFNVQQYKNDDDDDDNDPDGDDDDDYPTVRNGYNQHNPTNP